MLNRKMIYSVALIAALLLAAAGCSAAAAPSPLAGTSPSTGTSGQGYTDQTVGPGTTSAPSGGITVTGVGTATGTPDVAYVTVGVQTQSGSVQQAVNDNKTKMTALLDALKAQGISDKDIQTTNYSVYTEQPSVPSPQGGSTTGPLTYHVTNQVNVTVRDVSKLGDVLDSAVAAGANSIYGVNFGVSDPSKLQADARAKAVADAKARAQSLAQLAGVTLGNVVSISESSNTPGPIYAAAAGVGGGGAPVQPGELNVNVTVQITYAIK